MFPMKWTYMLVNTWKFFLYNLVDTRKKIEKNVNMLQYMFEKYFALIFTCSSGIGNAFEILWKIFWKILRKIFWNTLKILCSHLDLSFWPLPRVIAAASWGELVKEQALVTLPKNILEKAKFVLSVWYFVSNFWFTLLKKGKSVFSIRYFGI